MRQTLTECMGKDYADAYVEHRWPGSRLLPENFQAEILTSKLLAPKRFNLFENQIPFSWAEAYALARELECDDPHDCAEKAADVFSALTNLLTSKQHEPVTPKEEAKQWQQ